MDLSELKAKAEAATPEACEPIIRFGDGPLMWYPAHRPECIHTPVNLACDCDKEQREAAMYEYAEAYNPKVGLALVKVVEALNEFDLLTPFEDWGYASQRCRECGIDPMLNPHTDFCPWPKLVKAREELEAME